MCKFRLVHHLSIVMATSVDALQQTWQFPATEQSYMICNVRIYNYVLTLRRKKARYVVHEDIPNRHGLSSAYRWQTLALRLCRARSHLATGLSSRAFLCSCDPASCLHVGTATSRTCAKIKYDGVTFAYMKTPTEIVCILKGNTTMHFMSEMQEYILAFLNYHACLCNRGTSAYVKKTSVDTTLTWAEGHTQHGFFSLSLKIVNMYIYARMHRVWVGIYSGTKYVCAHLGSSCSLGDVPWGNSQRIAENCRESLCHTGSRKCRPPFASQDTCRIRVLIKWDACKNNARRYEKFYVRLHVGRQTRLHVGRQTRLHVGRQNPSVLCHLTRTCMLGPCLGAHLCQLIISFVVALYATWWSWPPDMHHVKRAYIPENVL